MSMTARPFRSNLVELSIPQTKREYPQAGAKAEEYVVEVTEFECV